MNSLPTAPLIQKYQMCFRAVPIVCLFVIESQMLHAGCRKYCVWHVSHNFQFIIVIFACDRTFQRDPAVIIPDTSQKEPAGLRADIMALFFILLCDCVSTKFPLFTKKKNQSMDLKTILERSRKRNACLQPATVGRLIIYLNKNAD